MLFAGFQRLVRSGASAGAAAVLGWFQEGFDTADLKEAKALLDKLENPAALLDAALVQSS